MPLNKQSILDIFSLCENKYFYANNKIIFGVLCMNFHNFKNNILSTERMQDINVKIVLGESLLDVDNISLYEQNTINEAMLICLLSKFFYQMEKLQIVDHDFSADLQFLVEDYIEKAFSRNKFRDNLGSDFDNFVDLIY